MPLTVLNVAFPLALTGPGAVGGAEQVVSLLDRALVAEGHRSIVVAAEGSETAGELMATRPLPERLDHDAWVRAHEGQRATIAAALRRSEVDVVHLHGVDFHAYLPPAGPPVLVTLHLPASYYPLYALHPTRPFTYLHCVSASQRAAFPPGVTLLEDVPNGVDLQAYRPARRKRGYVVAMGRVCEAKGFHLALDAAARAGAPLLVAGAVHAFPEHVRYFEEQIRPRLDAARRFLGPVTGVRKRRLLAGARCAIVSSTTDETCSLVALEALAAGTPVVAFRRGALPEVVEHGRTGFLVESVAEMADAIAACSQLSTLACREAAQRRFDARVTVRRYLELYRALALTPRAGGAGAPPPPTAPGRATATR